MRKRAIWKKIEIILALQLNFALRYLSITIFFILFPTPQYHMILEELHPCTEVYVTYIRALVTIFYDNRILWILMRLRHWWHFWTVIGYCWFWWCFYIIIWLDHYASSLYLVLDSKSQFLGLWSHFWLQWVTVFFYLCFFILVWSDHHISSLDIV